MNQYVLYVALSLAHSKSTLNISLGSTPSLAQIINLLVFRPMNFALLLLFCFVSQTLQLRCIFGIILITQKEPTKGLTSLSVNCAQ